MNYNQQYIITSVADNHYAEGVSVMMTPLLHHTAKPADIAFYIIDKGLSEHYKGYMRQIAASFHSDLHMIHADHVPTASISGSVIQHASFSSLNWYYSLFLPYIVDPSAARFLSIDADTVIKTDITALWDEVTVAATDDFGNRLHASRLPISGPAQPFDPGLLMVNAQKWRDQHLSEAIFSSMKKDKPITPSAVPRALHMVLGDQRYSLHPKWNTTTAMFTETLPATPDGQPIIEAICAPAVVHFTGKVKPWHAYCPHPYKYDYEHYRAQWLSLVTLSLSQ
ncbi:glycosyltransferase family 8 protein [Marinococcus sp. PL1-022]|uniref:glycosyltransferase family 8 protein n=1 Tax=Marinococcus sp. PL1-022 TaxID=3095363 RepID=UPI0029C537D9|nr:glycosyltransferase [Marinococcus sp. PL1-022]MDX6153109.1 glycosyltransferase [Marinococcus sp. PL1-022]